LNASRDPHDAISTCEIVWTLKTGEHTMRKQSLVLARKINRRLRFEGLEARAMLTGTVTATAEGGFLTITGDNAANSITVRQTTNPGDGTITIQIQGLGTKINNLDTGGTSNSATFTGVTDISVAMNGGNDLLAMNNMTVPNTLSVDMGDGNDILTMSNVHEQLSGGVTEGVVHATAVKAAAKAHVDGDASITLGTGNDIAVLTNVTSAGDFMFDAGDGRDVVVLNKITAGTPGSANTLSVDMGTGGLDILTVSNSSADVATFSSEGSNSFLILKHLRNKFPAGGETDTGFRFVV
jgi:hypothetical protein